MYLIPVRSVTLRTTAPRFTYGLLVALLAISPSAHASFQDNLTIGNAKALALGHAVTADPPGIDSIHYNPAGLARLQGRQMHLKGVFGLFETNYELGEYGEYQQGLIDELLEYQYPGSNGVIPPEAQDYYYDEALNSTSEVEGPTVMLPGGMVDLPFAGGPMGGASYRPPGSNLVFATNVLCAHDERVKPVGGRSGPVLSRAGRFHSAHLLFALHRHRDFR